MFRHRIADKRPAMSEGHIRQAIQTDITFVSPQTRSANATKPWQEQIRHSRPQFFASPIHNHPKECTIGTRLNYDISPHPTRRNPPNPHQGGLRFILEDRFALEEGVYRAYTTDERTNIAPKETQTTNSALLRRRL